MHYVTYTYVDAIDPSVVAPEELRGGPVPPKGCTFGFALESQYPTDRPVFYGTTSGATDLPGILSVATEAEYDAAATQEMKDREPKPIVVIPADLWRRASEDEAEAIEGAMAQQTAKLRNLFRSAQSYQSDDPLWPTLMGAATALFGADRAAQLLAPSAS